MVSPKETLELYRQLLTYLGQKTGKDLELVQRKTYGEVNELLGEASSIWPLSVPGLM